MERVAAVTGMMMLWVMLAMAPVAAMTGCDLTAAVCSLRNLKGSIAFWEKEGAACSQDDQGIHMTLQVEGFPSTNQNAQHNIRVKTFAGQSSTCSSMGPDFGSSPDLGTFSEDQNGMIKVNDVMVKNGPALQSIIGRSILVSSGGQAGDCCVVGIADPAGVSSAPSSSPVSSRPSSPPVSSRPSNPSSVINTGGFLDSSRFPAIARHSDNRDSSKGFSGSSFMSPFNLGSKGEFFDLSGKKGVNDILPDSVQQRLKAPKAPSFKDIFQSDPSHSPVSGSGVDRSLSSPTSSLSRMFFGDNDLKSAMSFGFTREEMNIPRPSGAEETAKDIGSEGGPVESGAQQGTGTQPASQGDQDGASFLQSRAESFDDDSVKNLDVSETYHNGQAVSAPSSAGSDTPAVQGSGPSPSPSQSGDANQSGSATSQDSYDESQPITIT